MPARSGGLHNLCLYCPVTCRNCIASILRFTMAKDGSGALLTRLDIRIAFIRNLECGFCILLLLFSTIWPFYICDAQSIRTDIEGLMAFKAAADLRGVLNQSWTGVTNPCKSGAAQGWLGITCNQRGRVSAVAVPSMQLAGTFAPNSLSRLSELRFLMVSNNSFSGSLPDDMANVTGLLQLWAQDAHFSGPFPKFLTTARRLVTLDLAGNNLTGAIPDLSGLHTLILLNLSENFFSGKIPSLPPRLLTLDLSTNLLTGNIPSLLPPFLKDLSLHQNRLTGEIPQNLALRFANISFAQNDGLCGPPSNVPCVSTAPPDPLVPSDSLGNLLGNNLRDPQPPVSKSPSPSEGTKRSKKLSTGEIVAIIVADVVVLVIIIIAVLFYCSRRCSQDIDVKPTNKGLEKTSYESPQIPTTGVPEAEIFKLVFVEPPQYKFDLEDLLRSSAEMLGKGSFGTAYKAVLDCGAIVAVKRLRDVKDMGKPEFDQQMELLGRLRHPNVVPLRAFYYAREEKLLVYDFMANGSLFSLLHGSRGPERTPLDWHSRLHIARNVAVGLSYLHQQCESQKIPHGNIKSSNILFGKNFEVCITDCGLVPLMSPTVAAQRMAGYRAPEYSHMRKISQKSDVYSFGVLLLELLTGRQPAESVQGDGIDLPKWVYSVVREEWTGEVFDLELKSFKHGEEEMVTLLKIAMQCVEANPEQRPRMEQVVKQIEDIRQGDSFNDSESFDSVSEYGGRDAPFNL